jgi:hypothetical protein
MIRWLTPAALAMAVSAASAPESGPDPRNFLRTRAGFSDKDLKELAAGRTVARTLETRDTSEVAAIGAVVVNATGEALARLALEPESYENATVRKLRRISEPPRLEDFSAFALRAEEVEALAKCRVGDCDVKLGATGLEEIKRRVDWSRPDRAALANAAARALALDFARAYLRDGNAALARYVDRKQPVGASDSLAAILGESPYLYEYVPELSRFLQDYPKATLPGARDFLYCAEEEFGPKPSFSINHVVVYRRPDGGTFVAVKQIYASHFVRGALRLAALAHSPELPEGAGYLIRVDRARIDGLEGFFGGAIRGKVAGGLKEQIAAFLAAARTRVNVSR